MNHTFKVLYVGNERDIYKELFSSLRDDFCDVKIASSKQEALELFSDTKYDLVLADDFEQKSSFLNEVKEKYIDTCVFVLLQEGEKDFLIECIKLGTHRCFFKPIKIQELQKEINKKREDTKLKEELSRKKRLFDQYNDTVDESSIVSKTDKHGIITYVNDKFCEISGYSREELVGKPHNIIRHVDMPKSAFAELWETIKKRKQTWRGKVKNRKKDGTHYWVNAAVKPILDENGNILEFIGLRSDISELENYKFLLKDKLDDTNRSLCETKNFSTQYKEALEKSLAIIKTDTNNVITQTNEHFCDISGYKNEEILGISLKNFCNYNDLTFNFDDLKEELNQNKVVRRTFRNINKDSSIYIVDTTIYPITDLNGKVIEYLYMMRDITELINLYTEIEETQKEIVYKMGEIGESRSKETGNHVKRVAQYSRLLALLAGLSSKEADTLYIASPMHDIGKVAIPDNILNKPARLTNEEFEIMKSHAQIGYEVLKGSSRDVLKAAAIVSQQHHEKWNGSGYPSGLSKEDIHIFGRITAIVDVYDALGHDRVYKKAWKLEDIYKFMQEQKGLHFDPTLVEIFLKNKDKFEKIREKYYD